MCVQVQVMAFGVASWATAVVVASTPGLAGLAYGQVTTSCSTRNATDVTSERFVALVKALESDDASLRRRAIWELSTIVGTPLAEEKLRTSAFSSVAHFGRKDWVFLGDAFINGTSESIPELIQGCRKNPKILDANIEDFLRVFGTLGPKAEGAIPLLAHKLVRAQDPGPARIDR